MPTAESDGIEHVSFVQGWHVRQPRFGIVRNFVLKARLRIRQKVRPQLIMQKLAWCPKYIAPCLLTTPLGQKIQKNLHGQRQVDPGCRPCELP